MVKLAVGCLLLLSWMVVASPAPSHSILLPAVANWITNDGSKVFALLENGDVMLNLGSSLTKISSGWSPDAPISFAHGRFYGINGTGELRVLDNGKTTSSTGAKLSKNSGLLALPAGVIAITESGDLVRLEQDGSSWEITARAKVDALRDGRVALADLEGNGDGAVVALLKPVGDRYKHGVLGDTLEPTAVAVFERHSLTELWRLELPAPFVFEDIQPRTVKIAGKDKLVLVRSSPSGGAALAMIELERGKLELVASNDFGQANRWLNPLVGAGEIYSVLTPHIDGVLTRYALQNGKLEQTKLASGVSSHSIGSRNLETGLVLKAGRIVLPTQDHTSLLQLECGEKSCKIRAQNEFKMAYSSNLILAGDALVMADDARNLNFILLE